MSGNETPLNPLYLYLLPAASDPSYAERVRADLTKTATVLPQVSSIATEDLLTGETYVRNMYGLFQKIYDDHGNTNLYLLIKQHDPNMDTPTRQYAFLSKYVFHHLKLTDKQNSDLKQIFDEPGNDDLKALFVIDVMYIFLPPALTHAKTLGVTSVPHHLDITFYLDAIREQLLSNLDTTPQRSATSMKDAFAERSKEIQKYLAGLRVELGILKSNPSKLR